MIQITLTFASMDAARRALLEIPESVLVAPVAIPEAAPAKKTVAAPTPTAPAPAAVEVAEPAVATESPSSVDYPTLQKAVFALAGKSREAAAAVAQSFGVKTFKELDQAKWADALAAVQVKTVELG